MLVSLVQAPPAGTPERKTLNGGVEGVLYYFVHAMRLGWSSSVSEMMPQALRLMFAVQEDGDKELSQVCTRTHILELHRPTHFHIEKQRSGTPCIHTYSIHRAHASESVPHVG
jgi:hypothetical protein